MFSHQQISHFHAFGFVVLLALLDRAATAQLKADFTVALTDIGDRDDLGYDAERWHTWRELAAGACQVRCRQTALERLRLLGVLAVGAQ